MKRLQGIEEILERKYRLESRVRALSQPAVSNTTDNISNPILSPEWSKLMNNNILNKEFMNKLQFKDRLAHADASLSYAKQIIGIVSKPTAKPIDSNVQIFG